MSHDVEVHDVAITPDGRFAVTAVGGRSEIHVWELATGRRVAPPLGLYPKGEGWSDTLAITPDGRRALVGLWQSQLALVDLHKLLATAVASTADLELLAQLATSQRIDLGDLSGLTTDQWREQWDLLRQRNPGLARSSTNETKLTHAAIRSKQQEAQSLIRSGVQAFQEGRLEAAVDDLQQACLRLGALRHSQPEDPLTVRLHGVSLGFLASSLRDLKRPADALERAKESLAAYESMADLNPGDFYNVACGCSMISVLDEKCPRDKRENFRRGRWISCVKRSKGITAQSWR